MNVTGLLRQLQVKIENIYLFKVIKKHGNGFKTWLCPNFLVLPKNSKLPQIWGGEAAAPFVPRPVRLCFQTLEKNKTTRTAASCFQMFSRVWKPDEILALVFEIVLDTRTLRSNLQLN